MANVKALITNLIYIIMIERSIMLGHSYEVEIECTPRDRVYSVELSGLWLNLIKGFTELFNAIEG